MKYGMQEFKKDFDKVMEGFKTEFEKFPWEDKAAYAGWCAQTYYYVCHSTRLLAFGAARCSQNDQVMHRRFIEHLSEEKGHEKLATNDLKALGYTTSDFPELPEMGLFYQNQYYWLNYHGAIPFFGWILALEGAAVHALPTTFPRVETTHGRSASAFMRVHAGEDIEHLDKALEQIQDLPSEELQAIAKNMKQSAMLYWSMLNRVAEQARGLKTKKAA